MLNVSLIKKWGSFVRFSHTVFALPFALAAMLVAARDHRGWPGWRIFGLILAAMVCARTCAMAFNRIVDRKFDALNPRTQNRHLPAGTISLASAVSLCMLSGAGLVVASYFLNPICFHLSPVALVMVCFYSLTKRFTDYTHVFLGIALALAPIGAWLAVKGEFGFQPLPPNFFASSQAALAWLDSMDAGLQPIILALAVILWLVGFDIIYALQDYEFDKSHGLRSLVVAWGPKNALAAAFLSHMVMCGLLLAFAALTGIVAVNTPRATFVVVTRTVTVVPATVAASQPVAPAPYAIAPTVTVPSAPCPPLLTVTVCVAGSVLPLA